MRYCEKIQNGDPIGLPHERVVLEWLKKSMSG